MIQSTCYPLSGGDLLSVLRGAAASHVSYAGPGIVQRDRYRSGARAGAGSLGGAMAGPQASRPAASGSRAPRTSSPPSRGSPRPPSVSSRSTTLEADADEDDAFGLGGLELDTPRGDVDRNSYEHPDWGTFAAAYARGEFDPGRTPLMPAASAVPLALGDGDGYPENAAEAEAFYLRHGYFAPPRPADEVARLRALYKLNILHTSDDLNFDRIVNMIRDVFGVKMAFLTLLDRNEHWHKACSGCDVGHTSRAQGFAAHVVLLRTDEPMVVLDTADDWRFKSNPHVVGAPHMRFYAGAPVRSPEGYTVGSLSIADDTPREDFSPKQRHILKEFAAIVMRELELWSDRLQLRTRARIQTALEGFTRECLTTHDDKLSSPAEGEGEAAGGSEGAAGAAGDRLLARVYSRAASVIASTLDLGGCTILDISHFQSIGMHNADDGSVNTIYHTNQYRIGDADVVPMAAFPVLASTCGKAHRALMPDEHQQVSAFLTQHAEGQIYGVPPRWIRSVFPPGVHYSLLVPVLGIDNQPVALIAAHTRDQVGPTPDGKELQFLRNVGSVILSAVLRRRMALGDRAKNVLISSVSHELRTPLHGILAASELLSDTALDVNQAAFLATLRTCGEQLIETVNDVLDYAKLSSEGKGDSSRATQLRRADLADLVHQAVEGCWLGQRARHLQTTEGGSGSFFVPEVTARDKLPDVEMVIDIAFRPQGWNVVCETGGLRRCIMNLVANSLKFTPQGYVQIALRELAHTPGARRIPVELSVIDTGKGIGREFLKHQLFEPFAQENPLQPGTGLGLAIVANIITSDALQGQIDVYSVENVGTEIKVTFEVELADADDDAGSAIGAITEDAEAAAMGAGYTVGLVNYTSHRGLALQAEVLKQYASALGFTVTDAATADILIANEMPASAPPDRPLILVVSAVHDAAAITAMGRTSAYTGVLYKPLGTAALRRELAWALRWLRDPQERHLGVLGTKRTRAGTRVDSGTSSAGEGADSGPGSRIASPDTPPVNSLSSLDFSTVSMEGGIVLSSVCARAAPVRDTRPPRILVVEDNAINRRVLAALLRKRGFVYEEAVNGQAGVDAFCARPVDYWDVVLMDISMPIMDGLAATRAIRAAEAQRRKTVPAKEKEDATKIFALTGFGTVEDKRAAFASGVDGYLVKPISLGALDSLFTKIGL